MREIDAFLQNWGEDSPEVKAVFSELYGFMRGVAESKKLNLDWQARPGVCYSLCLMAGNATAAAGTTKIETKTTVNGAATATGDGSTGPVCIARLDIVDDDPEDRWLTLYLDAKLAADPDGRGDLAPRALNGRDAICFDIDENDEEIVAYLDRIIELMSLSVDAQ